MSKISTFAAIDIGSTKVVAIVGTKDEMGRLKVLGFGEAPSKGVVRGSVQNVGEVSSAIKLAVKRCQDFSGVIFKNVFVGIAGQNIRTTEATHSRVIKNQIISKAEIDELTQEVYNLNKESGEEIIHVIPQYYTVDNNSIGLNPVGCFGKKLGGYFYVVIGRANAVQKIRQASQTKPPCRAMPSPTTSSLRASCFQDRLRLSNSSMLPHFLTQVQPRR